MRPGMADGRSKTSRQSGEDYRPVSKEDVEHLVVGPSADPPGAALGDLSHVRRDLLLILSLAGLMLLILVVTAQALG